MFQIRFLDHVALRVADVEASARWYEEVLGLQRHEVPEWSPYPLLLLCGQSGIALFPEREEDKGKTGQGSKYIDHFAFQVSRHDLELARNHFELLQVSYSFEDHHHAHSLYVLDPDGHKVELMALMTAPANFYPSAPHQSKHNQPTYLSS